MNDFIQRSLMISCIALSCSLVHAADVIGMWKTIDDKTGVAKSIIKIEKNSAGKYGGTIVNVLPRPGYTPKKYCVDCPEPFTQKPIEGMTILWGLEPNASQVGVYEGGKIIDPLSGKIYKAKIKLLPDGNKLDVRGFIGFSLIGRSQIWHREN